MYWYYELSPLFDFSSLLSLDRAISCSPHVCMCVCVSGDYPRAIVVCNPSAPKWGIFDFASICDLHFAFAPFRISFKVDLIFPPNLTRVSTWFLLSPATHSVSLTLPYISRLVSASRNIYSNHCTANRDHQFASSQLFPSTHFDISFVFALKVLRSFVLHTGSCTYFLIESAFFWTGGREQCRNVWGHKKKYCG